MDLGHRSGVSAHFVGLLVVDDSPAFRAALISVFHNDPEIRIVGEAADGDAAIAMAARLQPDVITMDIVMPGKDGVEAARAILAQRRVPIILLSHLARSDEQRAALNALRIGVVDVANKPVLAGPQRGLGVAHLRQLVLAAAHTALLRPTQPSTSFAPALGRPRQARLIAIVASTGGPPALEKVLVGLPPQAPPVVVAQHLAPSFTASFSRWLAGATRREVVVVAEHEEPLLPGRIYIAADRYHVRVTSRSVIGMAAGEALLSPNGDVLLTSAAEAFGNFVVGVVLTGMGRDGAEGLRAVRAAGGWTIGQSRESCAVYGMPAAAAELGACCEVMGLEELGRWLGEL